jgi:hypothetical protein
MITQEHIENFSKPLTEILDAEITLGNKIAETSKGWPKPEMIIIFLTRPFLGDYKRLNIGYRELNDPHYWKAEYFDDVNQHVLACPF